MKIIKEENTISVIRFDAGDEVIEGIKNFCRSRDISGGHFSAIGAAGEVILSYYSLGKKEYRDKDIKERLEITGLIGNIAMMSGEIIVHAHGTFSDENAFVHGGHVKKLIVSATCEVFLEKFPGLSRAYDDVTGLNLLN